MDRKWLVDALTLADKCVADEKSRVDDYKCFKFKGNFVSAFDGEHGIAVGCEVQHEVLVFAARVLPYLKSLTDLDEVKLQRKELTLRVHEAEFACPEADDFPDLLTDMDPLLEPCAGLVEALSSVVFCTEKSATRLGVPFGVLCSGQHVYASDTKRSARSAVAGNFREPLYIPAESVKLIMKLGDPSVMCADDDYVAACYMDTGLYYRFKRVNGPRINGPIDDRIEQLVRPEGFCSDPPGILEELNRLKKFLKKGPVQVDYSPALKELVLTATVAGKSASERAVWSTGPREAFSFKVHSDYLIDAIKQGYDLVDLSGLPKTLLFLGQGGREHLIELDY